MFGASGIEHTLCFPHSLTRVCSSADGPAICFRRLSFFCDFNRDRIFSRIRGICVLEIYVVFLYL